MSANEKIYWAVDPFAEKASQLKVPAFLKAFGQNSTHTIEPIAVLSPDQLRLPIQAFRESHGDLHLAANTILNKWTKGLKVSGLQKHSLVLCDQYSRRKTVKAFLDYAKENKAGLIALTTHARQGVSRWLLGSFAETLLLQSPIPLLILSPKAKLSPKIKTIFFPTDLSDASHQGFHNLLSLAARLKAKVVLFHKIEYVIPETYSMVYQTKAYEKYLEEDVVDRRTKAEKWVKEATAKGVKIEIAFDQRPTFVTQAIVKSAQKHKADLIALVSSTGEASATMLGSITRQVVREATCPIWALHVFD